MASALLSRRGGRSGRRRRALQAEINVTPFVDVMLVLLIIFMVTAPLLTVSVPVDLPQANAPSAGQNEEPLVVSVDRQGQVYLQDSVTELDQLVVRLQAIGGVNPETRIFVRGDRAVDYGRVVQVMGAIAAGGYKRVALVAELPQ